MTQATINPQMILLAREARGMSQSDLAERLNSYKASVSRLEHGDGPVDEHTLIALAEATHYPPHFFMQKGEILPVNLSYRKRKQVPAKLLTPIEAQMNIIRNHVQLIINGLGNTDITLPVFEVTEKHSPEQIANLVRKSWRVPAGPIENLSRLMEDKGILISSFDFATDRVDSRSMLTDNNQPIIFLNRNLLGDRQRFSLAFELGHLIMHTYCTVAHDRDINHEANLFAAEFLMPAKDILPDYKDGITLSLLGELKRKWKVSMISLLYRADDLGLLTPNQKRYLVQQFNDQKIRRREPPQLDVPKENPQRIRQLITELMQKARLNIFQLCTLLAIEHDDYIAYYG
ncbi:MAG: XRE family transcriptional regulator [Bacteroidetes bacterium]|jgi:Zn-dependent peptidase ImmA (M78 family)/DNA-binding XRE family transcriptional regulator|nr:XRE family transcriptional regulator [Bacteroidota bacterium]